MKATKFLLPMTGFVFLLIALWSVSIKAQTLKDVNGKSYQTCKVGMQEWVSENLNVDRFQNGDIIPQAKTEADWEKAGKEGKPAWCYYSNDTASGRKFGRLYNFYAITDPRGLAPKGWHVPSNYDWSLLIKFLGGIDVAGIKLKSVTDWKQVINGNNKSGFTAIPGGSRNSKGAFSDMKSKGQWWSTSGDVGGGPEIWSVALNSFSVEVGYFKAEKGSGLSIRCVKD